MKWPWSRPEVRSANYTDQIIAQILASATGASDGSALAAIETAARIYGAGLSSATVTPSNLATRAITPSVLDTIGRALCRAGESLHIIDVRHGRVTLTPTANWTVQGDADPESWMYLCNMNGPSTARMITLPAASVLHIRYAPHPSRQWKGRSPLTLALDTFRVASLLENATAGELSFTQKQVLTPRRSPGEYAPVDTIAPETIQKIVDAFSAHVSSDAFVIPADVQAQRLGPEPPDSFAMLRKEFEQSIYSSCGIPPALLAAQGTGTAMREAFRQVLHGLLKPLGALVVEEIQAKLHPEAALSFDALRAGDITGSARAFGSLVTGGLSAQSAAAIVGFDDVEVANMSFFAYEIVTPARASSGDGRCRTDQALAASSG